MSGDQLNLDAIEARRVKAGQCEAFDPYGNLTALVCEDVPALVAEVRRLQYALRDVRNSLGPDRICDCTDLDCGLREEAGEALAIAREALGT